MGKSLIAQKIETGRASEVSPLVQPPHCPQGPRQPENVLTFLDVVKNEKPY